MVIMGEISTEKFYFTLLSLLPPTFDGYNGVIFVLIFYIMYTLKFFQPVILQGDLNYPSHCSPTALHEVHGML